MVFVLYWFLTELLLQTLKTQTIALVKAFIYYPNGSETHTYVIPYSAFGKNSDPFAFSLFVTLQPYSKIDLFFFLINLQTIPHNDKAKTHFWKCWQTCKKKLLEYHICISIQTLYSVLSWNIFGID
jgi:hypothetical protein